MPGSHLKVAEIEAVRQRRWGTLSAPADMRLEFAADTEPFTACGLQPVVTSVKAGDCMLFDTRLFHGGCSAEDPSGASGRESGRGPQDLLRAVYILGMAHTHLQTPEMLVRSFEFYSYSAAPLPLLRISVPLAVSPRFRLCGRAACAGGAAEGVRAGPLLASPTRPRKDCCADPRGDGRPRRAPLGLQPAASRGPGRNTRGEGRAAGSGR